MRQMRGDGGTYAAVETYLLAGSPVDGLCWTRSAVPNRVCQKHSSAVPVPQGFQKLDQFGIYSFSAGFYAAGLSQGSLMFHFVRAWLHCAPAHWIVLTTIPQSPTDSASLISPLLPALVVGLGAIVSMNLTQVWAAHQ